MSTVVDVVFLLITGLLRCGKSCRLRWINYLKPDIKRGNFTKEEEDTIIQLHEMMGNRSVFVCLINCFVVFFYSSTASRFRVILHNYEHDLPWQWCLSFSLCPI